MTVENFSICLGLRDFNAADMFRMGMIERFLIDDAGVFDLRIREISALTSDVEEAFESYLDLIRKEALAAGKRDCQVHVLDFRAILADAMGKFHGAYSMCTMHLGGRLIGRRFEPAVEIPERFAQSNDRLSILLNRLWPPLMAASHEEEVAARVINRTLRGYRCGLDLYLAPNLKSSERRKLQ